jgi:hypothetical protein
LLRRTGRGLEQLNPRQLCNYAYALLVENKNDEERDEFLMELYAPLDAGEQFSAAMARMGMPVPPTTPGG